MTDPLHRLAHLYHIQSEYRDGLGQLRKAPPEAILSTLRSLNAPLESFNDVADALRHRRQSLWQRSVEPVIVAWENCPLVISLRLPSRLSGDPVSCEIYLENGEHLRQDCEDSERKPRFREIEGIGFVARSVLLRRKLPAGYHRLQLRVGDLDLAAVIFLAPPQAYAPARSSGKRWGVFCPLYALRTATNWGAGDYSDLAALARFVGAVGGHAVGTLPMLAGFLDEPFNPSPYAPVSRLFWNEFYLDVTRIPEFAACPKAQALAGSESFRNEVSRLRAEPLVEYRKIMALKRSVLEELIALLMSQPTARREQFESYIADRADVRDYAAFRAKVERERRTWHSWEEKARSGELSLERGDEPARWYHLYAQWQCEEQTRDLGEAAKRRGASLYLDFPLGANRDGYDVWRERDLFALSASGGAPPDGLFVKGQNWGFPPFHPEAIRYHAHRYYIACLRHHMAHASMLRIDHVMGMHRTFWVPEGFGAADGLYVHYRAEEFYAVLNLESHRHQVEIVGENLGTVPDYVNWALHRHKILGMHVGQFALGTNPERAIEAAPAHVVASLNTHDTATFMGFWNGAEIHDRLALELIDDDEAEREGRYRAAQRAALETYLRALGLLETGESAPDLILKGWLTILAGSDAEFLLLNLEDLWLEEAPQNVPGTWQERPNWRRKTRRSLEDLQDTAAIVELLKIIGDKRAAIS